MSRLPAHEELRLRMVATGRSRAELALDDSLTAEEEARFAELVARRLAGEPLQYLEGTVSFGPLELAVDRRALIPRPETELLWEMAVEVLADGARPEPGRERERGGLGGHGGPEAAEAQEPFEQPPDPPRGGVIVDVCTGSGNLALALKAAFPEARVYGTDLSEEALSLAKENAVLTGLEVELLHGDLFDPLPGRLEGRVDLLVANPPYVSEGEAAGLPAEVGDHEPRRALVAGPSGDEVVTRIAEEAPRWLRPGGWLLCEIAEPRAERARELFSSWSDPEVREDLTGRPRILVARREAPGSG